MLRDKVVNTVTGNKMVFLKFPKMTQNGSYNDPKCSSFRDHFFLKYPGDKVEDIDKINTFYPWHFLQKGKDNAGSPLASLQFDH